MGGALDELKTELIAAASDRLVSLTLYGSVVRPEHDERTSDIELLVVLDRADATTLRAIAPALRRAWRRARVAPYIVTASELPRLADVFPTKLLDLARHRLVLHGDDVIAGVEVRREHVRLRIEQELRNHLVRLRARLIRVDGDAEATVAVLRAVSRGARLDVVALARLADRDDGVDDLATACAALGLDTATARDLADVGAAKPFRGDVDDLAARTLRLLEQVVAIVDQSTGGEV